MNAVPATILLIEDEVQIRRFLRPAIAAAEYRLVEAATGEEGVLQATQCNPEIVILDLGLPDFDGLEVIRRIREWSHAPILILSARGQEQDKVAALDLGADDYVQKPFSVGELMARVRVALRRSATVSATGETTPITAGNIQIDLLRREVRRNGELVHLTPMEYKLLTVLARNAGLVMTHRQVLKEVWGPGSSNESHYLRIFVHQLRQKLEDNPSRPRHLVTESGVGYRFRID